MDTSRRALIIAGLTACLALGVVTALRFVPAPAGQAAHPERLPEIVLPDLAGTPRTLDEWSDRILLINFWATWCPPCRREMPLLQALQDSRDPGSLRVIGIAIDRLEPVERFITEAGISYPILVGEQDAMAAAERFGAEFTALPFTALVAPDGSILQLHTGELHAEDLDRMIGIADRVAAGELGVAEAREHLVTASGGD